MVRLNIYFQGDVCGKDHILIVKKFGKRNISHVVLALATKRHKF